MILFPEGRPMRRETFHEYVAAGGYQPIALNIISEIAASGLRGRGGAGFPVARKWGIAAETEASERYVVCNAGEDEPGSFKDRVLLEHRPHLVLEGMILAARAIRGSHAWLYLNETYQDCLSIMNRAIADARAAGFLDGVTVSIHPAPTVYVAGEDSAALEVIEGRPPKPRSKPPYPASSGLYGKPTVVNNVETLANAPLILRKGAAWFRAVGTAESPGTMVFSLGDEMNHPGAYEAPFGTPLRELYERLGGGLKNGKKLKAMLPGPSSAFLTPDQLDIPLDPESFARAGATLGCGVMRFFSEDVSIAEETLRIAQFFARESCGQCPACRMETSMLAAMLERIREGKGAAALVDQFPKILEFNRGKGYCALIHMPGPPILSALRLFPDEFGCAERAPL